jgi:4-diphosphocytidyl-2-C-methyl-D-erythritol kinase
MRHSNKSRVSPDSTESGDALGRAERAFAKVNLTLRVVGRRPDGYHDIESLVVFSSAGDKLAFTAGPKLALSVRGPTAASSGAVADNLVLKAARALAERMEGVKLGRFALSKRLPVAAGLGGGSADAAAALRLLARANRLALDDPRLREAARATGADVPACLDPRPRLMRGIGDLLSEPIDLPRMAAVLVNPGVGVPTKDVFTRLNAPRIVRAGAREPPAQVPTDRPALLAYLRSRTNDLEAPAIALAPAIADVLAALQRLPGCRLARMSGSGATCFGLFDSGKAAAAARLLRTRHAGWWVRATVFG